jgi:hypothetical protein
MNGELAQIIALATHARAYLRGCDSACPFLENSTCVHCHDVIFIDLRKWFGKWKEKKRIGGPDDWFRWLKDNGATDCRIWHIPSGNKSFTDRISAGFSGGGGRWVIESIYGNKCDHWESAWDVSAPDAPGNKPWQVKCGRICRGANPIARSDVSVDECYALLIDCLARIRDFAQTQSLEHWVKWYDSGINAAESDTPLSRSYYPGMVPDSVVCVKARRLLGAVCASWAFGGMGSWNDQIFAGKVEDEYVSVSDELFDLMNRAIQIAVNEDAQ